MWPGWPVDEGRAGGPGRSVERLITTFDPDRTRASGHDIAMEIVRAQAEAVGLPLVEIPIPDGALNRSYERAVAPVLADAAASGVDEMSFGDLHLADIREYRLALLEGSGIAGGFRCGPATRRVSRSR